MTPMESYMQSLRPVLSPYRDLLNLYAEFLNKVGAGDFGGLHPWLPTKKQNALPKDVVELYPEAPQRKKDAASTVSKAAYDDSPVAYSKPRTAAAKEQSRPPARQETPVTNFFDPFRSWSTLAGFIPGAPTPDPVNPQPSPRANLTPVPSAEAEAAPSKVAEQTVAELARQAEQVRAELVRLQDELVSLQEKHHEITKGPALNPAFNPFGALQKFSDMAAEFVDAVAPTAKVVEGGVIEGRAVTDPAPKNDGHANGTEITGGITHAAAHKRAKKAWRTRHANMESAEDAKAARRRKRSHKDQ